MIKLIFGFPVHEKFEIALDLYFTIRKFNNNPLVLFSSNQDLGNSVDNLKRVPSKRVYGYGFMHNFVFDMCEVLEDMDFDYFVKLDSDSLFANYGFEKIFEKKFDFCAQIEKDGALEWNWGKNLFKNLKSYLRLLDDLGLRRRGGDERQCRAIFLRWFGPGFSSMAIQLLVEQHFCLDAGIDVLVY